MKARALMSVFLIGIGAASIPAAELGSDWTVQSGDWRLTREIVPILHQRQAVGAAASFCNKLRGTDGVWRASVKLSQGTKEAGLWIQGGEKSQSGLLVLLGQYSSAGGFVVRTTDGTVLWQDKYAPWYPYHAYVVEAVVEGDRFRAQVFEADGKMLLSQSPWITHAKSVPDAKRLGLFSLDGPARFFHVEKAQEALSPIVPDPPNKRRLIQDDESPWLVVGPGNWMWITSKKRRLRQYADCERTWAMHRGIRGAHRKWECRVKVDPGTKGAGILVQTNEERTQGFIVWLGGAHGAGSLMLYQYEPEVRARWSGKSDSWHYSTEYLLRAETRGGQTRVQLFGADGETVISESPWIDVGEEHAGKEGSLGFHVWSGRAEFWGFSEETQGQTILANDPKSNAVQLGGGWQAFGDGDWHLDDLQRNRLRQRGKVKEAVALNTQAVGSQGTWRCHVRPATGTGAVGLVFQASRDGKQGFVCLATGDGARLETLQGKVLWEDPEWTWQTDKEYLLEGVVMTDRVAARVKTADGKKVLTGSPDIYVSDSNNTRKGYLGLLTRGGAAEFRDWRIE